MCASLTEVSSRNSPICVNSLLFSADSSRKINPLRINLTFNQGRGNIEQKANMAISHRTVPMTASRKASAQPQPLITHLRQKLSLVERTTGLAGECGACVKL